MRKSKRFIRKFSERFIVYIVVFVAFVNACFFMPIEVQAADYQIGDYMNIICHGSRVYSGSAIGSPVSSSVSFMYIPASSSSGAVIDSSHYMINSYEFYIPLQFNLNYDSSYPFVGSDGYVTANGNLDVTFDVSPYLASSTSSQYIYADLYKVDTVSGISVANSPATYTNNDGSMAEVRLTLFFDGVSFDKPVTFNVWVRVVASNLASLGVGWADFLFNNLSVSSNCSLTPGLTPSTDTAYITDGFDDSAGSQVSSDFESGVNDYDQAEDNLFNTSTGALQGFEFFDFGSFSAVTSGLSFCSSLLTSIYENFGGLNGIGIVISVLFSVLFTAIVIGLFRYYK